jgi:hypothetical protein
VNPCVHGHGVAAALHACRQEVGQPGLQELLVAAGTEAQVWATQKTPLPRGCCCAPAGQLALQLPLPLLLLLLVVPGPPCLRHPLPVQSRCLPGSTPHLTPAAAVVAAAAPAAAAAQSPGQEGPACPSRVQVLHARALPCCHPCWGRHRPLQLRPPLLLLLLLVLLPLPLLLLAAFVAVGSCVGRRQL